MQEERRLEILGILAIALSVFVLVSLGGYNSSEEPSISSHVQVTNPMGILGIFTAHFFIKLGFGYSSIIIPLLGLVWGWFLFAKKELDDIIRGTNYGLGTMVLLCLIHIGRSGRRSRCRRWGVRGKEKKKNKKRRK